jgi:Tol biopolymer transport system component
MFAIYLRCLCILTMLLIQSFVAEKLSAQIADGGSRDPVLESFPTAKKLLTGGWKGAFSPDGKSIVYGITDRTGLVIESLSNESRTELAEAGKDATWSPDGKWIAFVKEPRYDAYSSEEIWIISPAGESARKLADGGFPQWSADSTRVFYHSRRDGKVYSVDVDKPESSPRVFYDKSPRSSYYPAISPDEKKLAFGSDGGLKIVEVATGTEILSFPARGSRGLLPAWSPDGTLLAYGGFNSDRLGIWVLDVDSKKARRVVKGTYTMPCWSPDGSKLTFDYRAGDWEIWSVDVEAVRGLYDQEQVDSTDTAN